MDHDENQGMTRRKVLGGLAASGALGLVGGVLPEAVASADAETIRRLIVAIDDVPTETFDWGTLKWLVNAQRFPGAEQTVGIAQILPGKANPVHYHPNCEEVLYMISGRGRHSLDGESIELTPGMAIRIPKDARHNMENTGWETILCLVSFSSGDRQSVFLK